MKFAAVLLTVALAAIAQADRDYLIPVKDVLRPGRPSGKITGGEEATPHEFPWQVGLEIPYQGKTAFCGGSLIAPNWVVTAAHCGELSQDITVILGAHNISDASESTQKVVKSKRVIVHESWDSQQLKNDIALIELAEEVTLDENINTVPLPDFSEEGNNFAGLDGIASGWGKDSDAAESISPILRKVTAPTVTNLRCRELFGILGLLLPIHDSNICIDGTDGKSTCNGDSGGPLIIVDNGAPKLVGLTSFGVSLGCEKGYPAVFTRITSYVDWIARETATKV